MKFVRTRTSFRGFMTSFPILDEAVSLHEAQWWETEADGRIHCYLCPRHCHIRDGQGGFCFIRVNRGGRLYSLGYGAPRSEEHTSELQSLRQLVCRLLLEKKKYNHTY